MLSIERNNLNRAIQNYKGSDKKELKSMKKKLKKLDKKVKKFRK